MENKYITLDNLKRFKDLMTTEVLEMIYLAISDIHYRSYTTTLTTDNADSEGFYTINHNLNTTNIFAFVSISSTSDNPDDIVATPQVCKMDTVEYKMISVNSIKAKPANATTYTGPRKFTVIGLVPIDINIPEINTGGGGINPR